MQRAGEGAGCLLEYWRAGADELHPSGGRRTVELYRKRDNECQDNVLYCITDNILRLLMEVWNVRLVICSLSIIDKPPVFQSLHQLI